MMIMKRVLALILALLMVFCTACGKDKQQEQAQTGSDPSGSKQESQKEQAKPLFAYKPTYIDMDFGGADVQYVNNFCISGDKAFFVASVQTGTQIYVDEVTGEPYLNENGETMEVPVQENVLYGMDLATGVVTQLPLTTGKPEEGQLGSNYFSSMTADGKGGFWLVEESYRYHFELPEDYDSSNGDYYQYYVDDGRTTVCRHFDSTGAESPAFQLAAPEGVYLGGYQFLKDGSIYATDWMNIYRFDSTGAMLGSVVLETGFNTFFPISDTEMGVTVWENGGYYLVPIDPETLTMGVGSPLPSNAYQLFPGFGEYKYLYLNNDTVYGLKDGAENGEKVLSWLDCDVDSAYLNGYSFLEDGTVYAMENRYDSDTNSSSYRMIRMDLVDASTIPQKKELKLACLGLDWNLRTQLLEFNRKNEEIRIVVEDYSQYATDEDYYAGMTKLNTEILSGNVPDLFIINERMPMETYAAKGILMDLWPMIDADAELSREDLMTHFFDVLSIDGKLYQVVSNFSIDTVAGRSDVIGMADSWTLEDLMMIRSDYPDASIFGETDTREGILQMAVLNNVERFVDWNSKQCSFNTETFEGLLELAKEFPEEFNYEDFDWNAYGSEGLRMRMRRQLLCYAGIGGFDMVQYFNAMCDGKVNFIGYPTSDGTGSSFAVYGGLAISAACSDPDAAWKFVRTILTEEYQTQEYMWNFPTNRHSFDAYVQQMMTPQWFETDPETGEEVESPRNWYWFGEGEEIPIYSMTQAEYDLFMDLYERTNSVSGGHEAIAEIIRDECKAFFAGEKSAKDTAALIQDRVSLYVFEQG